MSWMNPPPPDDTPDEPDEPEVSFGEAPDREIEQWLREIPLQPPGAGLDARVGRLLRRQRFSDRVRLASLGAAALLAVSIGLAPALLHRPGTGARPHAKRTGDLPPAPAPESARAGPVRIEHTVARVSNDGIVAQLGKTPLRGYRYQSVRQVWLVDPARGTRVAVTLPREQLVLVPDRPL